MTKVQDQQRAGIRHWRQPARWENFDALLVGNYQGKQLMFAGKVRAGFTPAHVSKCSFANLPNAKTGRWGEGVTAEDMAELRWRKP